MISCLMFVFLPICPLSSSIVLKDSISGTNRLDVSFGLVFSVMMSPHSVCHTAGGFLQVLSPCQHSVVLTMCLFIQRPLMRDEGLEHMSRLL